MKAVEKRRELEQKYRKNEKCSAPGKEARSVPIKELPTAVAKYHSTKY